jgi:uncharacterized membrane protein HdeD (DUF308 family)
MEANSIIGDWKGRLVLGVIALILGFMFIIVPGFTLRLFLLVFGMLMIISGIVLLVFSMDKAMERKWRMLNILEGLLAIAVGIIAIVWPGITALWAIYLVGFFAVFSGIMQIAEGIVGGNREAGSPNRWLLLISGVWSLILGFLFLLFPGSGALALMWLIGLFLVVAGVLNIASGLKLRSLGNAPKPA